MKCVRSIQFSLLAVAISVLCGYRLGIAEDIKAHPKNMPITCELSCREQGDHIWADVTFSNMTEVTVPVFQEALLKVKKLEGIGFWVTRDGKNVLYQGILIKRPPPRIEEFYLMKPHEVTKARVEISKYFDFSKAGDYLIGYSCISQALPLNSTNLLRIESNQAAIERK